MTHGSEKKKKKAPLWVFTIFLHFFIKNIFFLISKRMQIFYGLKT